MDNQPTTAEHGSSTVAGDVCAVASRGTVPHVHDHVHRYRQHRTTATSLQSHASSHVALLIFRPLLVPVSSLLPTTHPASFNPTTNSPQMSRLFLIVLCFTLLSVSFASLASFPVSDVSASPADCLNSCSNNGTCVTSSATNASTCICNVGYLGVDCSVQATMTPICWLSGTFCSHWAVQDGYLYQRVWANSTTTAGWAAVMWGSSSQMAGGQSTILTVPSDYAPVAFDGYNAKNGKPTNLTDQSVAPQNVSGGATDAGLDVSFIRLLDTGLAQHYTIPPNGTDSTMGVAWSTTFFGFHGKNAHFIASIDIVGLAIGAGGVEERRVEEAKVDAAAVNRHGRLTAFMTPQ